MCTRKPLLAHIIKQDSIVNEQNLFGPYVLFKFFAFIILISVSPSTPFSGFTSTVMTDRLASLGFSKDSRAPRGAHPNLLMFMKDACQWTLRVISFE